MRDVRYFAPTEISEATKLLAESGEKATILAGGTDLVPKINCYELRPDVLLYIGGLDLNYIREEDGKLVIGATTPTGKLAESDLLAKKASALVEAARHSGCFSTRTTATVGGNLANGSPAADLAPPLMVMDAECHLVNAKGKRVVAVKEFFTGPGETVLRADELLTEIHVPIPKGKTDFLKLGRRKTMTLSVANVGVHLVLNGRKCTVASIALGSMAPTPLRCVKAEELITGKELDEALIGECATQAVAESEPIDDQRASAWYRKKAGRALVARALARAAGLES
ncbi:MAG: xanthine dehydrogenase family protein subunit M [Proteobacteria bacterium]|nr:xanthine dehydrogenase family protein subunit M [Pseudomonadota bacterium]